MLKTTKVDRFSLEAITSCLLRTRSVIFYKLEVLKGKLCISLIPHKQLLYHTEEKLLQYCNTWIPVVGYGDQGGR